MNFWWKLAFILTPSFSFGIGFSLGIITITVERGWGSPTPWFKQVLYSAMSENRDALGLAVGVFVKSLGWGFGLASVSAIILTIIFVLKKPWKANNKH